MRKQVDFDIRVFDVRPAGSADDGGMTHEQVRDFVKVNYLMSGWEVLGVENTQVSANHVFFAVYLAKYEDDGTAVVVQEVAKRGPGRPKLNVAVQEGYES